MTIRIIHADCREALADMESDSVDACVTDPPYGIGFMGKKWDTIGALVERPADRSQVWDHVGGNHNPTDSADQARTRRVEGARFQRWCEEWACEVFRVLKPGGHIIAFGGTRTYHRLVCAIEDAGFEIRDQLAWLFGSGFPKSHDVSKAIDRAAGAEREVVGRKTGRAATPVQDMRGGSYAGGNGINSAMDCSAITAPATESGKQWQGWGSALKPAHEPIVLARKPLIGTIAANVLRHGTGALNIDGCRIETDPDDPNQRHNETQYDEGRGMFGSKRRARGEISGRWPANVIHDGSAEVLAGVPETQSGTLSPDMAMADRPSPTIYGAQTAARISRTFEANSGSAARFFYTAKADADDRLGSKHPTVKPVDLMAYLVRLVTPPGGVVLDPFAGSGTTGMACMREGFNAILIEREAEYVADIKRRIAHVRGEDAPLFAQASA